MIQDEGRRENGRKSMKRQDKLFEVCIIIIMIQL